MILRDHLEFLTFCNLIFNDGSLGISKSAIFSHLFNVSVHTPYSDAICCRVFAIINI